MIFDLLLRCAVGVPIKRTPTIKLVKSKVFMCMRMNKTYLFSGVVEYMYKVKERLLSSNCSLLVYYVLPMWRSC